MNASLPCSPEVPLPAPARTTPPTHRAIGAEQARSRRDRWTDLVGIVVSAGASVALWATSRGDPSPYLPADSPWWARVRDHLLDGPDAGAWASNAVALWLGRWDELDPHRLPILPYLTAAALHVYPDPALAGHIVNHLLHVLLGPVVFLLGRRWMGAGPAVGAALLAVSFPPALLAADRYGVDPLVAVALPGALLAAEGASRRWALAPLFGFVVGLCACAHLTTIGIPVPAVVLTLLRGAPGWRRWLGATGLAAGVLIGVGTAFLSYPTLPWGILLGSLAEGVSPAGPDGDPARIESTTARAMEIVTAGGPAAVERVVAFLASSTRPAWLPWSLAIALPWLGALGVGLSASKRPVGWVLGGLAVGIPLAGALVPLLAFAAAASPPRYSYNYFPLGALLMMRGLASLAAMAEAGIARGNPRWPAGILGLAAGIAIPAAVWDPTRALTPLRMPLRALDLADWRLGALVREAFPPGGGAFCLRREVAAYAGRVFCPYTPGYDYRDAPEPVRAHLGAECGGEGPVPVVVVSGVEVGASDAHRTLMDWTVANGRVVATLEGGAYAATVYAVDRP